MNELTPPDDAPAKPTAAAKPALVPVDDQPPCDGCGKLPALCVCAEVVPVQNKLGVLILQHPQEQDMELGTARLANVALAKSGLRVGLSWPSLAKAVGKPIDPKRWAIIYLGSVKPTALPPGREVVAVDRKGVPLTNQDTALASLDGIVLLDGTWSQAKALWWRNAWMLKLPRLVLAPKRPSHYGRLRREPRAEGLSTLEAVALALARLEKRPEIETKLVGVFDLLLGRYRATQSSRPGSPSPATANSPGAKRHRPRRRSA
ncbi:MAG TPA: tRNA-uridine aminocarboxypropyltransferase [Stellaceae bacterium]|nr:tRNA-uridine aminocarboxypropyltransferase [Stellaceae bacterium]